MRLISAAACLLLAVAVSGQLPKFPLYKQCDPEWSNVTMGVPGMGDEDDTICGQGCAMSCVSMALAGFGISINGALSTPQTLNKWLQSNNGYHCMDDDCCNLVLDAPSVLAPSQVRCMGETDQPPFLSTLRTLVQNGLVVLAHVPYVDPHHFVLITGLVPGNDTAFYVNDPYYPLTQYDYTDIHDVLMYDILNSTSTLTGGRSSLVLKPHGKPRRTA